MVRKDNDLEDIGMDSFAKAGDRVEWRCWSGGGHSQSFSIVASFGRDVEGDPAIRLFERYNSDVLEVGRTGSSANTHG